MKITLCLAALFLFHVCSAQPKNPYSERIAYLDKNARPVKERQVLNGRYIVYSPEGYCDTIGIRNAHSRHIDGKPAITFMVDSEGRIETGDMYMQRSVEYSIDQTVLQLIRESPAWTPATQDGRPVRSYKTQPFGFKLPAK